MDFELGKAYSFFWKADTAKEVFAAEFIGGSYPLMFRDAKGTIIPSYELILVAATGEEINL